MKRSVLTLSVFLAVISCAEPTADRRIVDTAVGEVEIFPVSAFFREQLRAIDSLKLPTVKYVTTGNRKDTLPVSTEEVNALAREFIESDINDSPHKDAYKESIFADQSGPSVILMYTAKGRVPRVRRMNIIIDPDPVLADKISSVYIEKRADVGDTAIDKKLYWNADKSFQIVTVKTFGANPPVVSRLKVAWDPLD